MKRVLSILVIVVTASAALALSWQNWHTTKTLRTEVAAAAHRAAQARTALDQSTQRGVAVRAKLGRLERESQVGRKPESTTGKGSSTAFDWAKYLKDEEGRQRDPAAQLREIASERAKLRVKYGPLYRQLGWSPEKIAAFEALETHRREQELDVVAAASSQGVSLTDAAIKTIMGEIREQTSAEERTTLGEEDFGRILDYHRTLRPREMVRGYAASALVAGEPLTNAQAEQLVSTVAAACSDYAKGGDANLLKIDWTRVDASLATFLSPNQIQVVQTAEPTQTGGRLWNALCAQYNQAVAAESGSKPN